MNSKSREENQKPATPRERNLGPIIVLLVVMAIAPLGFRLYGEYLGKRLTYMEKVAERKRLTQEIQKIEEQNQQLKEREAFLKTRQGVESVARDKLGLTRPGEITFIVVPGERTSPDEVPTVIPEEILRESQEIDPEKTDQ